MSRNRKRLLPLVSVLLVMLVGCTHHGHRTPDPGYGAGSGPMETFPPAGVDLVEHDLRVDVLQIDSSGREKLLETLTFEGRMLLERGDPYVNQQGLRQIDFVIKSWNAVAWSEALGTTVIYRSVVDAEQPISSIVAEQRESDFPATFAFNVIFDAIAGDRVVFPKHHGRPMGGGFHRVPPGGDREFSPTITGFERTTIELEHPAIGLLRFRPRDCNDRESRTLVTFQGETPGTGYTGKR